LDKSWKINGRAVQQLLRSLDPLLRASDNGRAIFMTDPRQGAAYWSAYSTSKEAGLGFARSYAAEVEKSKIDVVFHQPPEMPTALRARFYPGQNADDLTPCSVAAEDVVRLLA
jgi:NAD(P)-dependent dehydrogenase (short-subunit alcohol dehydrogenase family)